ncbi:MAG: hypothetical protein MUO76_02615, partial [Anaerolineaceae bacterium]|nr:hypothetical protein [Anaerolineaceae bacterium]
NLAFLTTASISILIALVAPWFVDNIIAPGFPAEQKALTVELMRLDLVAIIIFSLSGLVMAGLHANQHFVLPAMAPGLYNIGQIFGAAILAPSSNFNIGPLVIPTFGLGIHGLVYGVIIGALLHLIIQIPGLIKYEFKWIPGLGLKEAGVRQVLILLGPRIITMFFIQMFFIVRDNLASGLGEGAVTALNLGWFIMQLPETILGTAFAIALLPTISELFATGEMEQFQKTIKSAIRTVIAVTIPAAALVAVGIRPLVQVAFNYDHAGTEMIVLAARIYLVGMSSHALLETAVRSFYAQKNALIPLLAAALNARLYIMFAILLSKNLGFSGIAMANTIAFSIESLLLLWLLNCTFPGILRTRKTILRVLLGTAISSGLLFTMLRIIPGPQILIVIIGMIICTGIIIPFIAPELRQLLALGSKTNQNQVSHS